MAASLAAGPSERHPQHRGCQGHDRIFGTHRVFGSTKITVLLGFTIAAYNHDRVRSHQAKQAANNPHDAAPPKRTRSRRRTGTWTDIVDPPTSSQTHPPP
jgi:hypothetical protein